MTIDEFAALFRVSRRTMEGLLRKHPVGFKVGTRWRFQDADVASLATTDPDAARAALPVLGAAYPGAHIVIRQRSRVLYDSERD